MLNLPQLYLASQSPRRRELLTQLGIRFLTLATSIPEIPQPGEQPDAFVRRMAVGKAKAGWQSAQRYHDCPILSADTIVVIDNVILGKPANQSEACAMLAQLSARTHQVITAIAIVYKHEILTECSISKVTFRALSQTEIQRYWETGEPLDKAGAYAIQGLAAAFVSYLEGSYSGVMGLPLFETAELLKKFGIRLPA